MRWEYTGGQSGLRHCVRTWKSHNGLIGMVKRWRGEKQQPTRYFVWADPDREYETAAQALKAASQK